jgi:hypothetical protein
MLLYYFNDVQFVKEICIHFLQIKVIKLWNDEFFNLQLHKFKYLYVPQIKVTKLLNII